MPHKGTLQVWMWSSIATCDCGDGFRFAAAQVWDGQLTDCYWEQGRCISPLKGKDCILYTCSHVKINCPPSCLSYLLLAMRHELGVVVEKCPEWTPGQCGNPPGEGRQYWMHRCNPIGLPLEQLPLTVACQTHKENGRFQCYLSQADPISHKA